MSKRTAILQTRADGDTATEALDVALALASLEQPVQLILTAAACAALQTGPVKRYGMLELLDAEPILLCCDDPAVAIELDVEHLAPAQLRAHLSTFDEVLQFS